MKFEYPEDPVFPYNVVLAVRDALQELAPHEVGTDPKTGKPYRDGLRIHCRRLTDADDTESIGVYPTVWDPNDESIEMSGRPVPVATVSRYPIQIQSWITSSDEDTGIIKTSWLAVSIKTKLENSELLYAALRGPEMFVSLPNGKKETVLRYGVSSQSFLPTELNSNTFGYLSITEFYVDTQIN